MNTFIQSFDPRQYMITGNYEYFHYKDYSHIEVDYHNHDFYEVFFYISGKVTYIVEGKTYSLKQGDIVIVNNKEIHKSVVVDGIPYERVVLWIKPDYLKKCGNDVTNLAMCFEASAKNAHNLIRPGFELHEKIQNIIKKLDKVMENISFGSTIQRDLYITELLIYLNRAYINTCEEDILIDVSHNEKISLIINYINEHLPDELSLDALSERFYISKYHLLREFKKYSGYTIHHYITKKRLIFASSLLKSGLKVLDVCNMSGFQDYANFIRTFKREFGMAPGQYAKNFE